MAGGFPRSWGQHLSVEAGLNPDLVIAAGMWSESRLIQEIEDLLDEHWTLSFSKDEDLIWTLTLLDGAGSVAYSVRGGFPNVVLLDGYAWLSLRASPSLRGTWSSRKEELTVRIYPSETPPDPPDLDPEEVLKVIDPG